jgi:hypothetical protein
MDNQKARKVLRYCFASLSLVIASGYLMQQAVAENLPSRLEATAERESFRQLEEGELDSIRGRYVAGNSVLLFGMEMSTVWKSPSGEMIEARGDLAVDLSGATPSVSFTPHITATSGEAYAKIASANGNEAVVVNDGTGNATGVVQLVQSGGDFNTASNNFQFDVNTGVAGTEAGGNGENSLFSATGTAVSIQHGVDGLGMSIVMPGEGEVRQGVYAGQGLHQSVQLTGSHHEVHNLTRMQVQMNQELGSKVTDGQLRRALEAARGLERHH